MTRHPGSAVGPVVGSHSEFRIRHSHAFIDQNLCPFPTFTSLKQKRSLGDDSALSLSLCRSSMEKLSDELGTWRSTSTPSPRPSVKGWSNSGPGREVASKEREVEKKAEEFEREVLMREERLALLEKRLEDCSRECKEREDRLASATDYLAECLQETEVKEKELISVRDSIEGSRRELGMKKQYLQDSLKTCCAELDSKKMELDKIRKSVAECRVDLDLKWRQLGSIKTLIDECNEELTSKKKSLDAVQKSVAACSAEFDSKKSELALLEESVRDLKKLLDTIQLSLDPAKLVLQALQEVDSLCARKNVRRVSKRSCLLLLRYLGEASLEIKPKVKEAAMALASQWKAQLSASSPHYVFGVLALFKLIVAGKKLAQISPKVEDCSQVQHTYKRSRVA
ncbi:hypothetical protein CRG98_045961 [Punica granatum]|uniref:FRIGIDA-like protein n=1 Tax=Punica granatum TaxID=22663 RepID=A0A2I0HQU0_PUNGR|nr:hypothetical protein CRG98_045961 [Punica granatum]